MPITAPSLSVADTVTGGGFTATLTGGDAGAANTLYRAAFSGGTGALAWTGSGSRTGPGVITGDTGSAGYWLWAVQSVLGAETVWGAPVYQNLMSSADSLHERVLQAVYAKMLTLPYAAADLKRVDLPADLELQRVRGLPAIIVSTFRVNETYVDTVNGHDDTGFPILVGYYFGDATKDGPEPSLTLWREITRRAFRAQRVPGVRESYTAAVEPGPLAVVDVPDTKQPVKGSTQIIRVMCREPRGA